MTTALQLINRSLRLLGVSASNESATGPEGSEDLAVLNSLMDEISNDKLLNHYVLNENFTTTANVGTYSIGPNSQVITDNAGTFTAGRIGVTVNGVEHVEDFSTDKSTTMTALTAHLASLFPSAIKSASYNAATYKITLVPNGYQKLTVTADTTYVTGTMTVSVAAGNTNWFNTVRPLKIESVLLDDQPLKIINNDQYQNIYPKVSSGSPVYINYTPTFPAGLLRLWPVPTTVGAITISQIPHLGRFYLISDSVELPQGYDIYLGYALAYELAPEYGKDPVLFYRQMADKKAIIMRTNYEPIYLECDTVGMAESNCDINSDR